MEKCKLDRAEASADLTVMKQGSSAPVFIGTDPEGEDFICGWCETNTLVTEARSGEFWDLAFQCQSCGGISEGPKRPTGFPLPFGRTVVAPAGTYLIGATVEMRHGVVFASRDTWDRRERERGYRPHYSGQPDLGQQELTVDLMEELVRRVERLVGVERFQNLKAAHLKGKMAKGTPPRNPHRLMELVDGVQESIRSYQTNKPSVHLSVFELRDIVALMERWQADPCFPEIVRAITAPEMFTHTAITLAAASMLTDAGNGVGLQAESGVQRSADLFILTNSHTRMQVEVKAPVMLQNKAGRLDEKSALSVLKSKLKRAGTDRKGQLSSDYVGMLVVGGFGLTGSDLDLLENAARKLMNSPSFEKKHIAGFAVLSMHTEITAPSISDGFPVWKGRGHIGGAVSHRFVVNPRYEGDISVERDDRSPKEVENPESVSFVLL